MKKIQLRKRMLELPETWDDLNREQTAFAFELLRQVYNKTLAPEVFRIQMLINLTGYRPGTDGFRWSGIFIVYCLKGLFKAIYYLFVVGRVRWVGYMSAWSLLHRPKRNNREIIDYNLYRLSEQIDFAFKLDGHTITPNKNFKENPVPELTVGDKTFTGRKFIRGIAPFTNITGKEFSDCFDIYTSYCSSQEPVYRDKCADKIISILYPATDDYDENLVSDHVSAIASISPGIRFGILFWFSGIVEFYLSHPVYSILFRSDTAKTEESHDKISIGMNAVVMMVTRNGYNQNGKMNLNDFFDAQIKILMDMISEAVAKGAKKDDIAQKTGLSINTINSLT